MTHLCLLAVSVALFLSHIPAATANPYVGVGFNENSAGYTTTNVYTTQAVDDTATFSSTTNPTGVDDTKYIGPVLSSAGTATGSCCSGYAYQLPVFLLGSDGGVFASPQVWWPPGSIGLVWLQTVKVGYQSYYQFYNILRMNYPDSSHVDFQTIVCATSSDCSNGIFTVYEWSPSKSSDLQHATSSGQLVADTDTRFLAGHEVQGCGLFCADDLRYTQVGIETGCAVSGCTTVSDGGWNIYVSEAHFLSGSSWVYTAADVVHGSDSYNVYYNGQAYVIGGSALIPGGFDYYNHGLSNPDALQFYYKYCGGGCVSGAVTWSDPTRNAQFVYWTPPPSTMTPGQSATVSVTMKNTGTAFWTQDETFPYRLGSQNPQDNTNWGPWRVNFAYDVPPGGYYTFTWTITAPSILGIYNFQWRMLEEQVAWFGDYSPNFQVRVTSLSCSASASPTSGHYSLSVAFTSSCSGGAAPYRYSWQFNDGSGLGSTAQNTQYTYVCRGGHTGDVYHPTLTVTDSLGVQVSPSVSSITLTERTTCPTAPSP